MKKITRFICATLILMLFCSSYVCASPTKSFSKSDEPSGSSTPILSREMYKAAKTITAASLGIENSLIGITDLCSADNGDIYILCGEESRIVVLNPDYSFKKELALVNSGQELDFKGAKGVFVSKSNELYIADTQNSRVIIANVDGFVQKILHKPDSKFIPKDFLYQPVSIALDEKGYTYILSLGSFYGALVYSPQAEFMGFYGANTVAASAMDTLKFLWEKLTKNDVKKAASLKTMPYSFVDLTLDADGYLVTCTGKTQDGIGEGQIRKISPNGQDILYKRMLDGTSVSSSSVNFMEKDRTRRHGYQNMISIAIDNEGFIYALDSTYGLIYVYDSECNLLSSFGGGIKSGIQEGTFKDPISLAVNGSSLMVADKNACSVTVFDVTDFGKLLRKANLMYADGDYIDAKVLWTGVLSSDRGNQAAYRGLAMASLSEGDNQAALKYAKDGLDYNVYDMAWQAIIKEFIADNFLWLSLIFLLITGFIIYSIVTIKKRKLVLIKNKKLKTLLSASVHPFQSFEDIKYKKQGSVRLGIILTLLLYLAFTLNQTCTGFLYNNTDIKSYNMLFTLAQTVGLIVLWCVSNWLVCALFSGKGRLSEVFISTAYCLVPLIIFLFSRVALSYILPVSAMAVLDGIQVVIGIYTAFLIIIGMMKVHEYDFFKFLLTTIVVVFLMIMIVFVLFLFFTLFRQVIDFIVVIYEEILYR